MLKEKQRVKGTEMDVDKVLLGTIILIIVMGVIELLIRVVEWRRGRWSQKELDEQTEERLKFYGSQ